MGEGGWREGRVSWSGWKGGNDGGGDYDMLLHEF